jgi:hypothetical protein
VKSMPSARESLDPMRLVPASHVLHPSRQRDNTVGDVGTKKTARHDQHSVISRKTVMEQVRVREEKSSTA